MARSPSSPIILPCPAKRVSAFSVVDGSVYRPPYQVRPFARPGHRQLGPLGTNGPYTFYTRCQDAAVRIAEIIRNRKRGIAFFAHSRLLSNQVRDSDVVDVGLGGLHG